MKSFILMRFMLVTFSLAAAFSPRIVRSGFQPLRLLSIDHFQDSSINMFPKWAEFAVQGIAEDASEIYCPGFGEPGWAPFCFLRGNPVFNAFDSYQAFIQSTVVGLHDYLHVSIFL